MKKPALLSIIIITALITLGDQAGAQLRKPQLGIYAGGTAPRGDFGDETDIGWHVGALFKLRVTSVFDVRVDGTWSKLGSKSIEFTNASVESESEILFGSLNAELNLGPDSAAYPGDVSVSPYITAGPGIYRHKFEGRCTGACVGFLDEGEKTKLGLNIGAGANVPFFGIPVFADFRYHRFGTMFPITQGEATATMLTASAGFKIR